MQGSFFRGAGPPMHSLPHIPRQIVTPNGFSHEESAFGIVWRGRPRPRLPHHEPPSGGRPRPPGRKGTTSVFEPALSEVEGAPHRSLAVPLPASVHGRAAVRAAGSARQTAGASVQASDRTDSIELTVRRKQSELERDTRLPEQHAECPRSHTGRYEFCLVEFGESG